MIAQKLKQETALYHDTIEQITGSKKIFENTFTVDDYKKLLYVNGAVVNGFLQQIYEVIDPAIKEAIGLNIEAKFDAIHADATSLNMKLPTEQISLLESNQAFALGALYVMEGSMLGGNVIAKTLRKNEGFQDHPFNYFTFYKEELGARWKQFVQVINDTIVDDAAQQSCVNGAKQVYEHLINTAKQQY